MAFEIPDFDWGKDPFWKRAGGWQGPPGATGFGPGGGSAAGGIGGGFFGAGPYDRSAPAFGYRRLPEPASPSLMRRPNARPMNALAMGGARLEPGAFGDMRFPGAGAMQPLAGMTAAGAGGRTAMSASGMPSGGGYFGGVLREMANRRAQQGGANQPDIGYDIGSLPYDPSDPWATQSGDPRGGWLGVMNRLLGAGGQAGFFDPMGSQAVMDAIADPIMRESANQAAGQRAALQARLVDNPNAYAMATLGADMGRARDLSGALSNARLQQLMQQQQFFQDLARMQNQFELGAVSADQQGRLQRVNYDAANPRTSGLGGYLGQIGGQALGGWLSPGGWWGS